MPTNPNAKLSVRHDSDHVTSTTQALMGLSLDDVTQRGFSVPVTFSVPLGSDALTEPEVNPAIVFYKITRDTAQWSDPEETIPNPTFGSILSTVVSEVQPVITFTGLFPVEEVVEGGGIIIHWYLTPLGVNAPALSVFTPTVLLTFTGAMLPGFYQGDWALMSNGGLRGRVFFTFEVQDREKLFQGSPGTVWYHLL